MKLIVGLGNPGPEYEATPHNLGFHVVDVIARRHGAAVNNRRFRSMTGKAKLDGEEILLAKPETFMNLSGVAVRELAAACAQEGGFEPQRDLIVIHDELAFPLGTVRIRERGSAGGHNGVESILGALGTEGFLRVRLGIAPGHEVRDGARYVLTAWKKKDLAKVGELVELAADMVEAIVKEGAAAAMNRYHRRDDEDAGTPAS